MYLSTNGRVVCAFLPRFLTDDQDQMLGGSFPQVGGQGPMAKTKQLMQEGGSMAERFYIHTPICNPSRSELYVFCLSSHLTRTVLRNDTPTELN